MKKLITFIAIALALSSCQKENWNCHCRIQGQVNYQVDSRPFDGREWIPLDMVVYEMAKCEASYYEDKWGYRNIRVTELCAD